MLELQQSTKKTRLSSVDLFTVTLRYPNMEKNRFSDNVQLNHSYESLLQVGCNKNNKRKIKFLIL